MKKAAGILFVRKSDGKILTASRRGDFDDIGIPGGKVDPGESVLEAAIREAMEETGIEVSPNELKQIYIRPCHGETDYEMTTFLCYAEDIGPRAGFLEPFEFEEGIQIRWATWEELCASHNAFSSYNTGLYEHVKDKLIYT